MDKWNRVWEMQHAVQKRNRVIACVLHDSVCVCVCVAETLGTSKL